MNWRLGFLLWVLASASAAAAPVSDTSQTPQANALQQMASWQLPQGKLLFTQQKWIRGLKRPLKSQGYLQLSPQSLDWVTEQPVQSAVRLDKQGVQQQLAGTFQLQAGTELIGHLMLAVLQQDQAFLQQYFSLQPVQSSAGQEPSAQAQAGQCVQLVPLQAPLTNFYRHIVLCGEGSLSRIELIELAGNRSEILLTAAPDRAKTAL